MIVPKISIIVPIYNVDKYLPRCLDSIIAQTYKDWELILVDDGSPDNCGPICDKYKEQDSRIRVLHKQHEGVSAARNDGIRSAKGEWITFIDSDDFISQTFIEEIYAPVERDSTLTFVQGGCVNYFDDGHTTLNRKYNRYEGEDKSHLFEKYSGLVCSKLYKRNILQQQSILYDIRLKYYEDHIFTLKYLFHIERYSFVDCIGYYYYFRIGSTSRTLKSSTYNDGIWLAPKIQANLTEEFFNLFNIEDSVTKKRRSRIGNRLSQLLQLYRYRLSATKRSEIFSEFRDKKYRSILSASSLRWHKKCLLKMLFNPYTFHLTDKFLVFAAQIRSLYRESQKLRQ